MKLSQNLAGAFSALSSRSHRPTHGTQRTSSGRSLAALGLSGRASGWDFPDMRAGSACGVGGRRTEGGQKVDGRWAAGTVVSVEFKSLDPVVSGGRPAGVQRVIRRFSEGASFVGSPANGSTWYRFRPAPAKRLSWAAAIAPTATRVELEVSVQFANLEVLP
jgi:hypothetical protein